MNLIDKLKQFFKSEQDLHDPAIIRDFVLQMDNSGQATSKTLHVAVIVLFLKLSCIDREIKEEETEAVTSMVSEQFGIPLEQVPSLVELAISVERQRGKLDDFLAMINGQFSLQQRERIFAMLWKLAIADGKLEEFEKNFCNDIKQSFGLSEEMASKARSLAEQGGV